MCVLKVLLCSTAIINMLPPPLNPRLLSTRKIRFFHINYITVYFVYISRILLSSRDVSYCNMKYIDSFLYIICLYIYLFYK